MGKTTIAQGGQMKVASVACAGKHDRDRSEKQAESRPTRRTHGLYEAKVEGQDRASGQIGPAISVPKNRVGGIRTSCFKSFADTKKAASYARPPSAGHQFSRPSPSLSAVAKSSSI